MVIDNLLQMAQEKSSENRRVLLRQITDMFFDGTSERSVSEKALFEEVVIRATKDLDVTGRADFANRIADEGEAPRNVILSLARDEIDVARPVLQRSSVLTDTDLSTIAEASGDNHLLAISGRSSLSEVVTDVLVRRGSQLVVRAVAKNDGAKFSSFGFGELVNRAKDDEDLQLRLVQRKDLPAEVSKDLSNILTEKLKSTLAAMGDVDGSSIDLVRDRLAYTMQEREREVRDIAEIVADIKAGRRSFEKEVGLLAANDRAFDIATIMKEMTGIDHATVMKTLTGTNMEPLVVLFRSVDASWTTFQDVLRLRAKRLRESYAQPSAEMQTAYTAMTVEAAQRVLRFLLVRRAAERGGAAAAG
ncbi:MAG: DUF2336 domain-containing protein [Labrys sp. (in: a-proteobacteria)]|jgi:uncharacterized protein (DUF2336 family)